MHPISPELRAFLHEVDELCNATNVVDDDPPSLRDALQALDKMQDELSCLINRHGIDHPLECFLEEPQ